MEHFEHPYKELALDMFLVILRNLPASDVHATNLADPIFRLALHQVAILKSVQHCRLLWHCLCLCLQHKQRLTPTNESSAVSPPAPPSQWNCRDDVCLALLTRLAFESDPIVRQFLIECIPNVFVPQAVVNEPDISFDATELRAQCGSAGICWVACRWTGKLVKIFCYHLSCCFGPSSDVLRCLRTVHRAYLVTLFAMPVAMCPVALRELVDELPTHLLQLLRHSNSGTSAEDRATIRNEVYAIFVSLLEHLRKRPAANDDEDGRRFFGGRAETLNAVLTKMKVQCL